MLHQHILKCIAIQESQGNDIYNYISEPGGLSKKELLPSDLEGYLI